MRRYLVAPAEATLLEVAASSPHAALRKASRGHAEPVDVGSGLAVPASRTTRQPAEAGRPIAGQLDLYGDEEAA